MTKRTKPRGRIHALSTRQLAIVGGGYTAQINDQTPADWNEVFLKLKSVACPDPLND